jgi:ParB family chromosome partitioning protein
MNGSNQKQQLKLISPAEIEPNPENPRLIFRQEEMESLMLSIDRHGIQVPLTVYKDGNGYKILDGERRWRCSRKLNLKSIPVIIQEKPSELENLVIMYNIHALREQWDYFTIASKLERVIGLYENENGFQPNEIQLSELTGLTRGAIRRCQLLINLPERFKLIILTELEKPKLHQKFTEDFFIEMEKAIKTIVKRIPSYESKIDDIRNSLIEKFRLDKITAVTDFRQLSKIATALDNLDIKKGETKKVLDRIFDINNPIGIREAYEQSVAFEYDERKYYRYIDNVEEFLSEVIEEDRIEDLDADLVNKLKELYSTIARLLEQ